MKILQIKLLIVQKRLNKIIPICNLLIMKQQEQSSFILPEDWHESLQRKFQKMTVLQLKKAKISMVKDLQEINTLLDEVIGAQNLNEPKSIGQFDRQIQKNKRMQRSLQQSLQNFEFMLTGDYSVKADEQIKRISKQIKLLKQQISRFSRMLSVPMQKDIEICEQLQKSLFNLQKDVEQGRAKNMKKKQYISQITSKIEQKSKGINTITKQIQKKLDDSEYEGTNHQSSSDNAQKYQQLILKKDKLSNIIERDQKRYNKEYKNKMKKYKEVEEASHQIQEILSEITKSLEEKMQQLRKIRQKKNQIRRHRNSDGSGLTNRKIKTEENSEVQNLLKLPQKRSSRIVSEYGEQMPKPYLQPVRNAQPISSNENLLPRLYKALGKSKLKIEEDCNIRDLLYM